MFKIMDADFDKNSIGKEDYLDNWPMVYILENGKEAYIGESNHIRTRMTQHLSNEEKRIFKQAHFIYSRMFNQSVTFDYESKLIQYISADKLFQVTNKNDGIADKQYFNKEEYDARFEQLWNALKRKHLVKHSLEEIQNSDLFKYSPYKELNDDQRRAVEDILEKLESGTVRRMIVKGMPGSGKTIVAVYLMKYLADSEQFHNARIGLVIPQTSLRKTLKGVFKTVYGLSSKQVLGPSDVVKQKYDILLVDEAHRLHQYKNIVNRGSFLKNCQALGMTKDADELDWIYAQSRYTIVFYDQFQVVGPSGIELSRFDQKLSHMGRRMIEYYTLMTQMRVQGGNGYIQFVREMLKGECRERYTSSCYDLKLYTDFSRFRQSMYEKEEKYQLTRMIAGYAWPWISQKDPEKKDIVIQGIGNTWNHCTEGWVLTPEAIHEVGCIHSIQGYDLNYAYVILGKDIGYDPKTGRVVVHPEEYYDKNGKNTATREELLSYIQDIYYVLLTRGIHGTCLFVCDDAYRKYLSAYMEVVE